MPSRRQAEGSDLCAVFVHAGAGYHSVQNEKFHLSAVNDAAKVAMTILKNGGEAADAVEMAIRLLEDREITNAGFGSNLTIEGLVECDATMVDHLGRSGAVGAVSRKLSSQTMTNPADEDEEIKNPIALARLVLEASSKPLSLQRVPPNLIVGNGATEFAAEHGFPILPHEYLISDSARNRWLAWRQDLLNADADQNVYNGPYKKRTSKPDNYNIIAEALSTQRPPISTVSTNDHTKTTSKHEPNPMTTSKHAVPPTSYHEYARIAEKWKLDNTDSEAGIDDGLDDAASPAKRQRLDGSLTGSDSAFDTLETELAQKLSATSTNTMQQEDHITDTVGAIAVDCFGNIAAGSSSGGIGMKHRGRCGPAALVGIGTAVIPIDPNDPDKTCIATVTSGTGEHMATTSAAATAANRIYLCVRKEGIALKPCDEDEALHSMIKNDFMKHPGVRDQPCVGAIGVLAVKKTKDGIYFYFGHNTDSFALASMHSEERKPLCTMSRSKGNASIAQGGRVAKTKRAKH